MCKSRTCYITTRATFWKRAKVADNSRSIVDGSGSILRRGKSVVITIYSRIIFKKGWSSTEKRWSVLVRSYPAISPGDARSTVAGVTPDEPHHETAIARPNPSAEEVLDGGTHAKGALGAVFPISY